MNKHDCLEQCLTEQNLQGVHGPFADPSIGRLDRARVRARVDHEVSGEGSGETCSLSGILDSLDGSSVEMIVQCATEDCDRTAFSTVTEIGVALPRLELLGGVCVDSEVDVESFSRYFSLREVVNKTISLFKDRW